MWPPHDRFARRLLIGSAPLMVWALHFFAVYVLVAAACCTPFADRALRATLLLASALAVAAIVGLLLRGRRRGPGSLLHAATTGSGVLALAGVVWTTLPMLSLPLCRCG